MIWLLTLSPPICKIARLYWLRTWNRSGELKALDDRNRYTLTLKFHMNAAPQLTRNLILVIWERTHLQSHGCRVAIKTLNTQYPRSVHQCLGPRRVGAQFRGR